MLSPLVVMVTVFVHEQPVNFEMYSGAACTLLGEKTFLATWLKQPPTLYKLDVHLCTWSRETFSVLGSATVAVPYKDTICNLPLLVVQGEGASLLGRDWFALLGIDVGGIHQTSTGPAAFQPSLDKFHSVFDANLTGCAGLTVQLELLEGVMPKFLSARSVPFTLVQLSTLSFTHLKSKALWSRPSILSGRHP